MAAPGLHTTMPLDRVTHVENGGPDYRGALTGKGVTDPF